LRDWRQRGIDHEGAQSIKTAERLGLLKIEVQAFLWITRREFTADAIFFHFKSCQSMIVLSMELRHD